MKGLFLIALLGLSITAQANTLYKCTDGAGHTTYTNTKTSAKSCAVLSQSSSPAPKAATATTSARLVASNPSPANFPRVSNDTQQRRDNDRRHILEQERAAELKNLEEARRTLAEQEAQRAGPERVRPYRDRIALHERNLEALRREMSNLK